MSSKFGISWIYEEFRISRFLRGKLMESWSSPVPVNNIEELDYALKEAAKAIEIGRGGEVAIAYESDAHTHSFLELPPMSDKDLEKYLERHVDQEKTFTEEAAWSYRSTPHGSKGEGVLLHLMPKNILDDIIKVCESNKLEPRRVVPLTEVMGQHIPGLPSQDDGIIVLISLFEEHVEIVVADGKGEAYFVRELGFHWQEESLDRLKLDIDRTLLYTKQQFGIAAHVWIMGQESEKAANELNEHFEILIESDPGSTDADFWAIEVISLPNKLTSNFIPNSLQAAFTHRTAIRVGVWTAAASLMVAIGSTLIMQSIKLGTGGESQNQITELENKKRELEKEFSSLQIKQGRLSALSLSPEPVPAWFLSYLGEVVPDGMTLSKASLSQENGKWTFRLEGATNPTLADSASTVEHLESGLSAPPWNAKISQIWRQEWLEKLRQGKAGENGLISFNMEGQM